MWYYVVALSLLVCGIASAGAPRGGLPAPGAYVNADGGPLLPLLKRAQASIDIEIYTMSDKTVRSLLLDALQRGVTVRILKDPKPFGSKCDLFGQSLTEEGLPGKELSACAEEQKFVRDFTSAGGTFAPFNKSALCPNGGKPNGEGCFEHGKIALVDGVALLSTGNFDGTNLCIEKEHPRGCNRDYSVIIDDRDVVDTLERIFEADLRGRAYDLRKMIPVSVSKILTVSPFSLDPIVNLLDSARTSIELEAQYLKDPTMNEAISRAANRGVKVSLTIASVCSFGAPNGSEAEEVKSTYSAWDKMGVSTRMFTKENLVNGHPGYMHAKVIVIDGARAWVGSVNGSTGSLTQNREYGIILDKSTDVSTVLTQARADHSDSGTESWQESLRCLKDPAGQ